MFRVIGGLSPGTSYTVTDRGGDGGGHGTGGHRDRPPPGMSRSGGRAPVPGSRGRVPRRTAPAASPAPAPAPGPARRPGRPPRLARPRAMRSGRKPGAMTYGATATRAQPIGPQLAVPRPRCGAGMRRRTQAARRTNRCAATPARFQRSLRSPPGRWSPPRPARPRSRTCRRGVSPASYSRRSSAAVSSGDGPSTSAWRMRSRGGGRRLPQHRRDVGLRVEGAGQQQRQGHDVAHALRRQATPAPAAREGTLKSRKPVSTRSPGRSARTRAYERVHGRGMPRVAAAVGDDEEDRGCA